MGDVFAGRGGPIVAGRTLRRRRRMIEPDIGPVGGDVTIFAEIGCGDMRRCFARRRCAVVAGAA